MSCRLMTLERGADIRTGISGLDPKDGSSRMHSLPQLASVRSTRHQFDLQDRRNGMNGAVKLITDAISLSAELIDF